MHDSQKHIGCFQNIWNWIIIKIRDIRRWRMKLKWYTEGNIWPHILTYKYSSIYTCGILHIHAVLCLVTQIMFDSCDPMDCSPPGSSVHGILQIRILEWVAIPFSRWSSQPRDLTWVSCIADTLSSEPLGKPPWRNQG